MGAPRCWPEVFEQFVALIEEASENRQHESRVSDLAARLRRYQGG